MQAGSDVKGRVAFDTFSRRADYHCHIHDYEDNGMPASSPPGYPASVRGIEIGRAVGHLR